LLAEGNSVGEAAVAIGCSRQCVYDWRAGDDAFRQAWDTAVEVATEVIESTLYKMAKGGDLVACIFWLKSHKPERYNRRMVQVAIGGDPNNPLTVDHAHHDAPSVVRIYRIPDNGRDSEEDNEIEGEAVL
jgi:hypothetical protein